MIINCIVFKSNPTVKTLDRWMGMSEGWLMRTKELDWLYMGLTRDPNSFLSGKSWNIWLWVGGHQSWVQVLYIRYPLSRILGPPETWSKEKWQTKTRTRPTYILPTYSNKKNLSWARNKIQINIEKRKILLGEDSIVLGRMFDDMCIFFPMGALFFQSVENVTIYIFFCLSRLQVNIPSVFLQKLGSWRFEWVQTHEKDACIGTGMPGACMCLNMVGQDSYPFT